MPTDAPADAERAGDSAGGASLELQTARYRFAAKHMQAGNLLDLACGVGDGSAFLRRECPQLRSIVGVDLSQAAIAHANQHHAASDIRFVQEDAMRYWDSAGFTNIVCLGMLEYLADPRKFLMRTAGMLRNHGTFVASASVTPSMDSNPRYQNDFSEDMLRALARECEFEEVASFPQTESFNPSSLKADYYKANPLKLLSRIGSTLRNGFKNRYLTIVWTKRN